MLKIIFELESELKQFVEKQGQLRRVSPEEVVKDLVEIGFETRFDELYAQYRRGAISLGHFAEELGLTTWETVHLMEERGLATYNLPA